MDLANQTIRYKRRQEETGYQEASSLVQQEALLQTINEIGEQLNAFLANQ